MNDTKTICDLKIKALEATKMCSCWCHMDPQPEYDSHRDYFETHSGCKEIPCSGRVPILDPPTPEHPQGEFGLRVGCGNHVKYTAVGTSCPCQDRGWIPRDNEFAWIDAGEELGWEFTYETGERWLIIHGEEGTYPLMAIGEASVNGLFTAILEAAEAQARKGE